MRILPVRTGVETSLPFVLQIGIIEVSVTSRDDKGVIFYNDLSQWGWRISAEGTRLSHIERRASI